MTGWRMWLYTLAAAGIGGGSNALLGAIAMPETFNLSHQGLLNLGKIALVGVLVPVLTFLKQSPLPATSVTATQTTSVTQEVTKNG